MQMLRKLGDRVLFFDTDSTTFISREGDWLPEQGIALGAWDNQLKEKEDHIISFVSLGPLSRASRNQNKIYHSKRFHGGPFDTECCKD